MALCHSGVPWYQREGAGEAWAVAGDETPLPGALARRRAALTRCSADRPRRLPGPRPLPVLARTRASGGRTGAGSPSNGKTGSSSNRPGSWLTAGGCGGVSGLSPESRSCFRSLLQPAAIFGRAPPCAAWLQGILWRPRGGGR